MSLIGGTGTFVGPLVGALAYRLLEYFIAMYTGYWMLFFGIILTLSVLFFPQGITPYIFQGVQRLEKGIRGMRSRT